MTKSGKWQTKNSRTIVLLDGLRVFTTVYKFVYNTRHTDLCKMCIGKRNKNRKSIMYNDTSQGMFLYQKKYIISFAPSLSQIVLKQIHHCLN